MVDQEQYLVVIDKRNVTVTASPGNDESNELSTWEIVGISLGAVFGFLCCLCLAGIGISIYFKKSKSEYDQRVTADSGTALIGTAK